MIAVHQRDIRFICDSNPMFLDKQKKIINAERMVMLGESLSQLGLDYPLYSFQYDIKPDAEFQKFLSAVSKMKYEKP